jgi:hypothetical protein
MQRFLRETWKLWYWAMFCPSKFQQQMNEWAPAEEMDGHQINTSFWNIFGLRASPRFIKQYLLLVCLFSVPLALTIFVYGQSSEDWLLLPLVLLTSCCFGILSIPVGLKTPLFLSSVLVFLLSTDSNANLPKFLPLLASWLIGIILSSARSKFIFFKNHYIPYIVLYSVWMSVALSTFELDWSLMASIAFTSGYFRLIPNYFVLASLSIWFSIFGTSSYSNPYRQAFWLAILSFALGYFPVLSDFLIILLMPALVLILSWGGISSFEFSPYLKGFLAAAILFIIGYFRWLPIHAVILLILMVLISFCAGFFSASLNSSAYKVLRILPPCSNELVWLPLPLPGHDEILLAAFRENASATLDILQRMESSALPAMAKTLQKVLPQIITNQLLIVDNIKQLVSTATSEHSILPLLVPALYQDQDELLLLEENFRLQIEIQLPQLQSKFDVVQEEIYDALYFTVPLSKPEITLFLRLKTTALDVAAALKLMSADLQARSLEGILARIDTLQAQLPKLGIEVQAIKRWQPVLTRWKRIVQIELEQHQTQPIRELLNPFQYGNPLRPNRAYLFKGRTVFTEQIVRLVLDRNRPTLALYGPRRCGKSSFLLNLPYLLPSDLLPVYLDLQSAAVTTDDAAFCYSLVRAIFRDNRRQGFELPTIPSRKEFLNTPYIALEDWLEQALPKLGDRRLLLNLDEFEKIGSAINEGRMSLNLFNELRHLIQHYDQLGFLFSGVQTLEELGPNWSSYFISVVPIEMLYLEPSEAEELLVDPNADFTLRYDTGIVEEILTLTRCHPYLLQLIGWSLVNLANERHTQLVTSDLLQAAIPEAFTNGQPYFTNVWTEFTGTSPAEVKAGQELLLALAQGNQSSSVAGNETAQAARRQLLRYHVIENINGSDRFEVPLIERWVRERAITN